MSLREPTESVTALPTDPGATPPPRPTRAQRITAFAFLGAFGLTIATVIFTGLWVRSPAARAPVAESAIVLELGVPQTIDLTFASAAAIDGVEITVDLPAGIEAADQPALRRIEWRTSLQAGPNRLPLTIVARGGRGGALAARLAHGDERKTFVVDLAIAEREGQ